VIVGPGVGATRLWPGAPVPTGRVFHRTAPGLTNRPDFQ